jgi:hypothetical protein
MPMRDGLYKAHFQTPMGSGDGVVVLLDGKLRGGDSMIYYVGSYSQNGDQFAAQVATNVHSRPPGMRSVFGRDQANITIKGTTTGDTAQMTGTSQEAPDLTFQATLARLGD